MKKTYAPVFVALCLSLFASDVSAAEIKTTQDTFKSNSVVTLELNYTATAEINQYDYVQVHALGAPDNQPVAWVYSNNTNVVPPGQADTSLVRNISFPSGTFTAGLYEIRFFTGGTYTMLSLPKTIEVVSASSYEMTSSLLRNTWHKNERIVVPYTYLDTSDFNFYDWVAVVPASATAIEGNIVWYKYMITDSTTGPSTLDFAKYPYTRTIHIPPQALVPGSYKLYFLQAGTYTPYAHETLSFTIADSEVTTVPSGVFDVPVSTTGTHEAFPTLIRVSDDHLVHVYRDALAHAHSEVGKIMTSTSYDGGLSWSVPRVAFDTPGADDVPGSGHVILQDGSLPMSMFVRPTSTTLHTKVLKSRDAGGTWSLHSAMNMPPSSPGHVPYGKMFMPPSTTTIVMPGYGTVNGGGAMYTSRDNGVTWDFFSTVIANDVPNGPDLNYTEAAILPITSSEWISVVRRDPFATTTDNTLYLATSTNGGVTWSEPTYLFEGASPDLTLLPNGDVLLCVSDRQIFDSAITNPQIYNVPLSNTATVGSHGGVRCHVSHDNGHTWSLGKLVFVDYTQNGSDHGYPYVFVEDNRVHLAYYREDRASIAGVQVGFMLFSTDYLSALDVASSSVTIAPSKSRYFSGESVRIAYKYPLQAPFNYYDSLEIRQGTTLVHWAYLNGTHTMNSSDFVPSIKNGMITIPSGVLSPGSYTARFIGAGTGMAISPTVTVVIE